jgi:GNAT superfamily N-acetyltransferase
METEFEILDGFLLRRYRPEDRNGLYELFHAAFGTEYDRSLWRWKFDVNPFQPPDQPLIYVVVREGEIAGSASLIPVPFQIEHQPIPFSWGADLMVHPRFSGRGIAKEIYRFLSENHEIVMSIGANPGAYYLLTKRTSWIRMDGFKLLSRYLDITPYLRNRLPFIKASCGFLSSLVMKCIALKSTKRLNTDALRKVDRIGDEFDELWSVLEPHFPVSVIRSSEYLRWRYQEHPFHDYGIRALYNGDKLRGCFIVHFVDNPTKEGFEEAVVKELLVDPDDDEAATILIQGAIELAASRGRHVVRCYAIPSNEAHLRRNVFVHIPPRDIRFFGNINSKRISDKAIKDPSCWLLSHGDSFND